MTDVPAAWTPLLTGEAAECASSIVHDIAAALRSPDARYDGSSLSRGTAGVAMFLAAAGDPAAHELVDLTLDVAPAEPFRPEFYAGIVGVGWALSRIERRWGEADDYDTDVDELVGKVLRVSPWPGSFDLVSGLSGLGVYCLERLPRESARSGLDLVVAHLAEMAEPRSPGVAWRSAPAFMPAWRLPTFSEGYFDNGLAHGNPGVVAFLAEAVRAGAAGARELLESAVEWLLAQRLNGTGNSAYPSIVVPDAPSDAAARLAWCYGDPGVAIALLAAGSALGSDDLLAEARTVTRGCDARIETSGVVDGGLCHGASGLGHIFNWLGQALYDEEILDLARRWFAELVLMRCNLPIAGFPSLDRTGDVPVRRPLAGVLEGAAGVGLALLSATTTTEPWWDAMLLLPRPAARTR